MPRASKSKLFVAFVGFILFVSVLIMLNAWLIMLLWGALGGSFGFMTIGYSQAILVSLAMSFVASFFRNNRVEVKR